MPVFNGGAILANALDALIAQTFSDFEIVVSDNASTDETPAILAAYAARDPRIRYVRNDRNIGANANFSRLPSMSTAPLFKWAAHDDLYAPQYLERCVQALETHPKVVLAHSDTVFIDETGQSFTPADEPGLWIEPEGKHSFKADPTDLATGRSPLRRFAHVVFGSLWGTHIFGVIPKRQLERTRLIQDVPNSDRPLLAELALLGPFHTTPQPYYLKRLGAKMSWNMSAAEIKAYVSGSGPNYSRRRRQLQVFLTTPTGKAIGPLSRAACRCVVLAYAGNVALRMMKGRSHESIRPVPPAVHRASAPAKLDIAGPRA